MREILKLFIIGIIFCYVQVAQAVEQFRVAVIPDNIVTDNLTVDAYIYNATSEFFANEIINLLNLTDYIKSPTVSEERDLLKSNNISFNAAKNLTNKYKTSYNLDFGQLKKVATKTNCRYVLLLTSTLDSENYILRRTLWDFANIPGATVVDPAYKINTYATLIDTQNNLILWSNTFYKTISVCENRIISRGPSPQTEQLAKIRDYSRWISPQIAQQVQLKVLPADIFAKESYHINYTLADFDNIFTKKYRQYRKNVAIHTVQGAKELKVNAERADVQIQKGKKKYNEWAKARREANEAKKIEKAKKLEEKQLKIEKEVKAEPIKINETPKKINVPKFGKSSYSQPLDVAPDYNIQNINYKKQVKPDVQTTFEPINIKKTRKNNLYGDFEIDRDKPALRNYN